METIIGSAIAAVVAVVTCLINNNVQRVREQAQIEMKIAEIKASNEQSYALITQRIETLTEHVNKHNDLIDRMYKVEALTAHLDDMLKDIREDDRR